MKLLWITCAPLDSPGYRATQFGIAISLSKLGCLVDFMGKAHSQKFFEGFPSFHGKVTLIQRRGKVLSELNYHFALWKMLYSGHFGVVIFEPIHLRLVFVPAIMSYLRFMNAKFVMDVRTPLVEKSVKNPIIRFNQWLSMKFAKWFLPGITIITESLKNDLLPYLGKSKNIAIWSSAVDTELFDPSKVQPISRDSFTLSNRFIFFYHGSVTLTRGLIELISAMGKLRIEYPNAALVLLGNGDGVDCLKKQTKELRLENTVYFFDPVPNEEVPSYIAMADVGVIPLPNLRCWQVSSPLKLFEYMAMQLPIVVSDIEAHRSVLGNFPQYAIYIKDVNPECIYKTLKLSIEKIDDLKKHSYLARKFVVSEYTWDEKAKVLSKYLLEMIN